MYKNKKPYLTKYMKFSKWKSKYQRSLRSMFSLTKEWTLASNKKQVLVYNFNNFIKYLEYFILNCKLFYFSIKKNYLFQLITFKEISHFCTKNYQESSIFLFLKKLKNSRSTIMLFFNIPFIISVLISEIFQSIIKKTIYFYRFFILLSIPVMIFCVNRNLILQNKKDSLSFILPESQKIFISRYEDGPVRENYQTGKNYLYLKNLRKTIVRNHIFNFLFQKIKNFHSQKQDSWYLFEGVHTISYLSYLPNLYERLPLRILPKVPLIERGKFNNLSLFKQFSSNNIQTLECRFTATKGIDQKLGIFSKWFSIYIKLKKNYSIKLPGGEQNNFSTKDKKLNHFCRWLPRQGEIAKSHSNLNSLEIFQFGQFTKKSSYFQQEFLQKFDSFFFSLIKPRYFNYLSNL